MGAAKAIHLSNDKRVSTSSFAIQFRPIQANHLAGSIRLTSTAQRSTLINPVVFFNDILNGRDQADALVDRVAVRSPR
jgi:hypothetical protein